MKFYFIVLSVLLSLSSLAQNTTRLLSYNIRYNNPGDGKNAWDNRKDDVVALLRFYDAEVVGCQEVLQRQLNDLLERLPNWKYVGVGRDDGKTKGEYAPILFDAKKFELVESDNFWLSEDTTTPNKGWDAVCVRICTWAKLKRLTDGQEFYIFNTHFDHVGEKAQRESAKLILQKMKEFAHGKLPIVLTGDFNLEPTDESIKYISKHIDDARSVSEVTPFGPEETFNAFKFGEPLISRIDYVFVSKHIKVKRYGVLTDSKHQRYYSDHFPVLTDLEF